MSKINCVLRTFLLLFVLSFLFACALVCRAATPDAEALLKRSDAYRNGWPSYVLRVKITHYEFLAPVSRPCMKSRLSRASWNLSAAT